MKKALITGITGQAGYWLSRLLLEEGYEVHGMVRRSVVPVVERTSHLDKRIHFHVGDLTDVSSLNNILTVVRPDEIYNLAAQSHVGASWELPILTAQVTGVGVLSLLEATREFCPEAKFVQLSSSEMFGNAPAPQNEETPLRAVSPYAAAKIFAHEMCQVYRESYDMSISCAICFNYESHRRGIDFVTRKITNGLAKIAIGQSGELHLGNLMAERDWMHAEDAMRAVLMLAQHDLSMDVVIGSGVSHSVQEFLDLAIKITNDIPESKVKITKSHIKSVGSLFRPAEVNRLCCDATKIKNILGWEPRISLEGMIAGMVSYELSLPI